MSKTKTKALRNMTRDELVSEVRALREERNTFVAKNVNDIKEEINKFDAKVFLNQSNSNVNIKLTPVSALLKNCTVIENGAKISWKTIFTFIKWKMF